MSGIERGQTRSAGGGQSRLGSDPIANDEVIE